MKKLDEKILKQFNMLVEYDIKRGVKPEPIAEAEGDNDLPPVDDTTTVQTTTDTTTKSTLEPMSDEGKPVEFEDTEEVDKIKKEEDLAKKDDITRIKEIQDMQTKKIEELESYISTLNTELQDVQMKTVDLDNMKVNMQVLHQQVEEITPPSPEQSLEKMAKISGGITIEDYWRDFYKENKPFQQVVDTNELAKRQKEEEIQDIIDRNLNMSDSEVKDSISKY